jgi:hexosaminidase
MMLDVSRHFFNKTEIKKILDTMALHKLNVFHWHLCDDQGWRIEIKKYPKLTAVGAWRDGVRFGLDAKSTDAYGPDGRYGGFYTQDDIREVVAYAKSKFITVVPEIEMPGHATAALAAYPELSCTGGPFTTDIDGGVFNGVYCAGNDQAFEFLENVLLEVFDLFPDKYVHIGGDEVPPNNWKNCPKCQERMKQLHLEDEHKLQSYFIQRMENFINTHNKTMIGWSEIREGGLAHNAVLMDWIGGGLEAAGEGHDVVMTPTEYCYFDYYQSADRTGEPHAQAKDLPLAKVYFFQPIPSKLASELTHHILGSQANMWTEYIPSLQHLEYMTYPRLCALAEALWSPSSSRQWEDFCHRLKVHCRRLDELGVNYRRKSLEEN